MKLLLADDHTLFRDSLFEYISRLEPDASIDMACDINEVMGLVQTGQDYDLILLDLRMPGMNDMQGLKKLRQTYPNIPVALLSGLAEKQDVERALSLGVSGYLPKTMPGKGLMHAIKEILDGKTYIAKDHNTDEIMPSYYGPKGSSVSYSGMEEKAQTLLTEDINLTPREMEVLQFLMKGSTNKEIARALDLQVVTVKLHVRGVCRKLGAKNRTQAALLAQEMGLF